MSPDSVAPHESGNPAGASASTSSQGDRRRSATLKLGITAAVAGAGFLALLAATGDDDEPTHAAVCVDRETGERAPDDQCGTSSGSSYHGGFGWYFIPYGIVSPRVGAPVSGGSYSAPATSSYVTGGVSPNGGVVSADTVKGGTKTTVRGGFGSNSKGSGG